MKGSRAQFRTCLFILATLLSACGSDNTPPPTEDVVVIITTGDDDMKFVETDDAGENGVVVMDAGVPEDGGLSPTDATLLPDVPLDGPKDSGPDSVNDMRSPFDGGVDGGGDASVLTPTPPRNIPADGFVVDGWQWMAPLPQGNTLRAVWGTSSSDVLAVGDYGMIVHWNGQRWTLQPSGARADLYGVWTTGSESWAVGDDGTTLHSDGTGWSSVVSGTDEDLRGVWGSGFDDVWAVGYGGTVLHWDGTTWTPSPGHGSSYFDVHGTGPDDVWIVGGANNTAHWDGASWTSHRYTGQERAFFDSLHSVWALGPDMVLASGYTSGFGADTVLQWDGTSWVGFDPPGWRTPYVDIPTYEIRGYGMWASGPDDLWFTGWDEALRWEGASWTTSPLRHIRDFFDIWGSGPDDVWGVGNNGSAFHWDGASWENTMDRPLGLQGIASKGDEVWAVGSSSRGGGVAHWDGNSLTVQDFQTGSLSAAWAHSSDDVWVVGEETAPLHWDGTEWTESAPPPGIVVDDQLRFESVWGSASDDVWASGLDGVLWHWDGTVWSEVDIPTTNRLHGLWGTGADNIYMVALDDNAFPTVGSLWHYDGSDWSLVTTPLSNIHVVWGSSADDVWAVGDLHIVHFDGNSWSTFESGQSTPIIEHLSGRGPDDVWGLDEHGKVWHWDGTTWSTVASPSDSSGWIFQVSGIAVTADEEWLIGKWGQFLRRL